MRRLYQKRQKNTYLINLERWEIPSLNFFWDRKLKSISWSTHRQHSLFGTKQEKCCCLKLAVSLSSLRCKTMRPCRLTLTANHLRIIKPNFWIWKQAAKAYLMVSLQAICSHPQNSFQTLIRTILKIQNLKCQGRMRSIKSSKTYKWTTSAFLKCKRLVQCSDAANSASRNLSQI